MVEQSEQHEEMAYDLVIVGGGPAGLSAAIRFRQLCQAHGESYSVCVLEKSSAIGGHILSGAVMETRALDTLIPDWKSLSMPMATEVTAEEMLVLTGAKSGFRLPSMFSLPAMRNHGNLVGSLGAFCRWLGEQAEQAGAEVFAGFAAQHLLRGDDGAVEGVITGDMGRQRDGEPGSGFMPGMAIKAPYTFFAEGCRGHLGRQLDSIYDLSADSQHQTYALGVKEVWEVAEDRHQPGLVRHSVGWPLDHGTYGGSFLYHFDKNLVAVGFVVALDYRNPHMNPFEEMQRFKTHPMIRETFAGGQRIGYGARALNEGGYQSIPKLAFPGGALIGCEAGTLNMPKIKGIHTAMQSGIIAAESAFAALQRGERSGRRVLDAYETAFRKSWVTKELKQARNVRPGFRFGLIPGIVYAGLDQMLLRGRAPWTVRHAHPDHETLKPVKDAKPIDYPRSDGVLTFDRLSSVALASNSHKEDQPVHLTLKDPEIPITHNLKLFDAPEQRYCPAQVYEIIERDGKPVLQINASNCVHCKTCDIKDPRQNIVWVAPEGGSGPNYPMM